MVHGKYPALQLPHALCTSGRSPSRHTRASRNGRDRQLIILLPHASALVKTARVYLHAPGLASAITAYSCIAMARPVAMQQP
jgi:hypothetical protein